MQKKTLLLLCALLVGGFFYFDLQHYLSLSFLKNSQEYLAEQYRAKPVLISAIYFFIYVAIAALSLPGAAILTLAAGAIFGTINGSLLVSFASSIGASLAFLGARYFLRDTVQNRLGTKLKAINDGIAKEGAFYLFMLRLVPVFPFFVINLLMGLTHLPLRTFYWVSQLGMLLGTVVYVNAGTQLGKITQLSDVLSVELLLSFTLLGIFPLLAKYLIQLFRKRRVYARWRKPQQFDRNLVVIGAGAAGLVTAYVAAAVKAKVTLIEGHKMGGDCLNYGCVPSKALIRSAKLAQQMRHAQRYGLNAATDVVNFREVVRRIFAVVAHVEPHDSAERYESLGVEVLKGHAKLLDPWTVEITDSTGNKRALTSRSIVLATGAEPFVPPLPGLETVDYLTSDTLWDALAKLDQPPGKVVILGGGPIGCELAQSLARLGAQVTQVEMLPRLMIREDAEVSAFVAERLCSDGVTVLTGHKALRVEKNTQKQCLWLENADGQKSLEFDTLICAVGRSARLRGYGLEELGIDAQRVIETNAYLQTLYPNIFAAGDVAGPYQFTHVAGHQAWYAAVNALFGHLKKFAVDYSVIPWVTFVDPEVARVGLNEQDAKAQKIPYEVTRFELHELDRAIADSATFGFIKVLTVPGKDRILGVTIVGEHGGDLLAEYILAMKNGIGLKKILSTIHPYPTLAEANKYAAGVWRRNHAPEQLLQWLARYHRWRLQ